jgi:hypothetical protein
LEAYISVSFTSKLYGPCVHTEYRTSTTSGFA